MLSAIAQGHWLMAKGKAGKAVKKGIKLEKKYANWRFIKAGPEEWAGHDPILAVNSWQ